LERKSFFGGKTVQAIGQENPEDHGKKNEKKILFTPRFEIRIREEMGKWKGGIAKETKKRPKRMFSVGLC